MARTATALCLIIAVMLVPSSAWAHDAKAWEQMAAGDSRRADWFSSLKQPGNGVTCCDLSDCHQTDARQLPDQSWTAIIEDPKGRRWTAIPPEKVVKNHTSIDGEAYICNSNYSADTIYCFVPPVPGY